MPVRGLTVIVTTPARFRAGLELAAAAAALGGRARVFCQGEAVAALAHLRDPHDGDYAAAGLPTQAELFEEALGIGVLLVACQSGLALMGIAADALDARIASGGLVSMLQTLQHDRLATL